MLKRTCGIFIPNEHLKIDIIKNDLTIKQIKFKSSEYDTFRFYEEVNGGILIPRYYPIDEPIEDLTENGIDIDIVSNIILKTKTQEDIVQYLVSNRCGILKALPGMGKTVCAIESICRRKKKALIIIHKSTLLEQWKREFISHTSLTNDDIGTLTTQEKKYKKQLDKPILLTTPHVIGLAVKKNKYNFLKYLKECGIGAIYCDEIHSIAGAEVFSKSCITINSHVTLGMSATPERGGKTNKILGYHFGDIKEFEVESKDTIIPKICIIKKDFNINKLNRYYINYGGVFDMNKYCIKSKDNPVYRDLIVSLIDKCFDEGRNTLIVGNYINPLLHFANLCKGEKKDIGIFLPTAKKKDILEVSDTTDILEAFHKKQLVFASYSAVRDGNSRIDLDAAIMTIPNNNPVQLIGRVTRVHENKKRPVVFDIVDTDSTIFKMWNNDKSEKIQRFEKSLLDRIEIYNKHGWPYIIKEN